MLESRDDYICFSTSWEMFEKGRLSWLDDDTYVNEIAIPWRERGRFYRELENKNSFIVETPFNFDLQFNGLNDLKKWLYLDYKKYEQRIN